MLGQLFDLLGVEAFNRLQVSLNLADVLVNQVQDLVLGLFLGEDAVSQSLLEN